MKKINLFILFISLILLCSCTAQKTADSEASSKTATQSSTQSTKSDNAGLVTSSQSTQWPEEFKDKLPVPVCKITNVTRYDEKSMSGKLTIVNFSDMSKADAEKYVEALKSMGFSGGIELNDGKKIAFSGVGKDQSAINGVNFLYSVSDQTGTISY